MNGRSTNGYGKATVEAVVERVQVSQVSPRREDEKQIAGKEQKGKRREHREHIQAMRDGRMVCKRW